MAWTLKDLRNFVEETKDYNENEIVYIDTPNYISAVYDGDIVLESDLKRRI